MSKNGVRAIIALIFLSTTLHAQTIYVKADATGANNGTSWADAYTSLQSALAVSSTQIWVAEGTYKPGSTRTSTFNVGGKTLYGGFAGTETDVTQRDLASHQTILSGEIGAATIDDNVGNVVSTTSGSATLDGFVITRGNTNGAGASSSGGGISHSSSGTLTVANCRIVDNHAGSFGGGVFAYGPSTFVNTVFFRNSAYSGSAIVFFNGGAITNCTISGQVDTVGTLYVAVNSNPTIQNTIVWANAGDTPLSPTSWPTTSSIIDDKTGSDPMFADGGAGDFHLLAGSPAIDAGTAVAQTIDADGAPRVSGASVDIGAFEFANNRVVVTRTGSGTGTVVSSPAAIDCGATCDATLTTGDSYQLTATADPGFRFLGWAGACSGATTCTVQVPASVSAQFGKVWYVNASATGGNTGTSWTDAFTDLQSALSAAATGDEIWVAAGTYHPDAANTAISFNLRSGVAIYGGFAGTETNRDQRDSSAHVTILSGDLGANGRSNSVVQAVQVDSGALLDGFTITGGNATDANAGQRGGGIYIKIAHPRIANCTISGNAATQEGGGINVERGGGTISNCVISNNTACNPSCASGGGIALSGTTSFALRDSTLINNEGYGGAIYDGGATFLIERCRIRQNSNFPTVYLGESFPNFGSGVIRNCEIVGTAAGYPVVQATSGATFLNCTIIGPSAPSGVAGAMSVGVSPTNVYNSILWGATDPSKNFNYGGYGAASNNISTVDPLFATGDPTNGNYRPGEGSPAIDAGNNTVATGNVLDLDSKLRPVDDPQTADTGAGTAPFIDIGAYELHPVTVSVPASIGACEGSQVTLTATASGYGTLTYQWRKDSTPVGSATTSPSYVINAYAGATDAGLYDVIVTDSLGSSATSSQIDVHDSSISISGFAPPGGAGGTVVTIDGSGFAEVTDVQFNGVSATITNITDTQLTVTVPLAATAGPITVVTPGCQATSSTSFDIPPFGPPALVATVNSQTSVSLSWTRVGGISGYEVKRLADPLVGYETLTTTPVSSFTDTTAQPDHAYVYRIDAVPASPGPSASSNPDLVTTFAFVETITQGTTPVHASQWTELRNAVDAVHVLAGDGSATFTNPIDATQTIKMQDLLDLRTAISEALNDLGLPPVSFTDTLEIGVTPVRAIHVTEIRDALQ